MDSIFFLVMGVEGNEVNDVGFKEKIVDNKYENPLPHISQAFPLQDWVLIDCR